MGSPGQHQRGLVNAANEDQLNGMLSKLESRWNNLEEPYNSPPCFHAGIKNPYLLLSRVHGLLSQTILPAIFNSTQSMYMYNSVMSDLLIA